VELEKTGELPFALTNLSSKWGKDPEWLRARLKCGRPKKYAEMSYYRNKVDINQIDYTECDDYFVPAGICPDENAMIKQVHQDI
jgi:hypothetical protein